MYLVFKTSKPGCRDGLIDRVLARENMIIGVHVPRTVKTGRLGAAPCNPSTQKAETEDPQGKLTG